MSNVATETLKRTSLYSEHVRLHGKLVPFAGFELPIQYTGILEEHMAVRQNVGIFDVSHMAQFFLNGEGILEALSKLVPADVINLPKGKAVYTQFTNEHGGVVDDLIIYHLNDCIMLVVNAANHEKDYRWLESHLPKSIDLRDDSELLTMVAVQGPKAEALMTPFTTIDLKALPFFGVAQGRVMEADAIVARTGYTGEDGFEIFFENKYAVEIWKAIVEAGAKPCGLGARDTLRLEAGLPLYGHELNDDTTPIESSLGWSVKSTVDYLGKDVIMGQKANGVTRKLVGLKVLGKNLPREGFEVYSGDTKIGQVKSGSIAPFLGHPIATAFVDFKFSTKGTQVEIQIRDKRVPAEVCPVAFYRRSK